MRIGPGFIYRQQFGTPPGIETMATDLSGRTIMVVGSNTGLGLECTRHLARMMGTGEDGGRLIMACRNEEKGLAALKCELNIIPA